MKDQKLVNALREVEHRRDEKGTCFWCDRRLRYICRDHPEAFVPREERYPNAKVPGMGKKFKAEPIGGWT